MEFDILGCSIRINADEENNKIALEALDLLRGEIASVKKSNSALSDLDVAVLSALRIASKKITLSNEYKEDIFSLRSEVEEAISLLKTKTGTDSSALSN